MSNPNRPRRALAVMVRQPKPGVTKKRLIPLLSEEGSARFYECLLLDTLDVVRSVPDMAHFVGVEPGSGGYFEEVAPDFFQVTQIGGSLGERLASVLGGLLDRGHQQVMAIGSDVPTLPRSHIEDAFQLLDDDAVDVVLGPSEDGGYHLIGWKQPHQYLVREVEMSTPHVLDDTLALAREHGDVTDLLPTWYDIDEPADLEKLRAELDDDESKAPRSREFLQQVSPA